MTTLSKSTVQLRAQEIVFAAEQPTLLRTAVRQALDELDPDREELLEAVTRMMTSPDMRKATYQLEDPDARQLSLWDTAPPVIAIQTPEGDLFLSKAEATVGQYKQWAGESVRYHAAHLGRAKRFLTALDESFGEEHDGQLYLDAVRSLEAGA